MKNHRVLSLAVVAIFTATLSIAIGASGKQSNGDRPAYNKSGELLRPEGYRAWVLAGTDLGIEYNPGKGADSKPGVDERPGDFHNVYISPWAYKQYAATGKFPDGTIFMLETFAAKHKEPQGVVSHGFYEDQRSGLAAAVKDSHRGDGSKTIWAYYAFVGPDGVAKASAKAFPDNACYQCHLAHASNDNVWVQFYPTLRDMKMASAKEQ